MVSGLKFHRGRAAAKESSLCKITATAYDEYEQSLMN